MLDPEDFMNTGEVNIHAILIHACTRIDFSINS